MVHVCRPNNQCVLRDFGCVLRGLISVVFVPVYVLNLFVSCVSSYYRYVLKG